MISDAAETFAEIGTPANPFPGLRPFEFDESHLFFGRDGQSEQLIGRLGRTRFLAVVGTSGSGKSSLVRAGLLPTLLGGFMTIAGSDWRIAIMRPAAILSATWLKP
jgi:ABC-type transport system involved in cytochrome bd biosynthesis fused ATPase/permease subunit